MSQSGDNFFTFLRKISERLFVISMSRIFFVFFLNIFLHAPGSARWTQAERIVDSQNAVSTLSGIYKAILQSESIGISGIPMYGLFGDLRH
jgi:hypothetical protein